MTRREFVSIAPSASVITASAPAPLMVPVLHILDIQAKLQPNHIRHFLSNIWAEAVRDFGRCGIRLQTSQTTGGITRPAYREPFFAGLERGVINLVITDRIPLQWDNGRALSGVTTLYRGYHLCMIALRRAHGHRLPFLSVTTCVHELLHALMHDVFENRPNGLLGQAREFRIDVYATRLWLLRDGREIREAAQIYVERLRSSRTAPA